MRRRLGVRLEDIVKSYEYRKPESGYKRTKYRLRGFHSDPVLHRTCSYGPQHTLAAGCAHQEGQSVKT